MFPQLKKLNNESGLVLFVVLMTAVIIMVFSVGILTQSLNETNYAQQQIDQIVSDQLSKGIFWNAYSAAYASGHLTTLNSISAYSTNEGGGGRTYTTSLVATATPGQYKISTSYDTFN